jgi:hypothetical protein
MATMNSCFVLVDNVVGLQIFSYDGKLISSPKFPGMRAEFLTEQSISISPDVLAVKDRASESSRYFILILQDCCLFASDYKLYISSISAVVVELAKET